MEQNKIANPLVHVFSKIGTPQVAFFIALLAIIAVPILSRDKYSLINTLVETFFIGTLYYLAHSMRPRFFYLISLILLAALLDLWSAFFGYKFNNAIDSILPLMIISIGFRLVFETVIHHKQVDTDTLVSAISGYILIGFLFGVLAYAVETMVPGSYNTQSEFTYYDAYYYSFVTLSTLGYGDITPAGEEAKALTIVTTLVGQFYIAIVMGLMVGKFLSNRSEQ